MSKKNQRLGNKEQTDSDQKGSGRGITGERRGRGRGKQRNTNGGLPDLDNGRDYGSGGVQGREEQ